ncbi:MAG: glutathione S-transferase family protein, partial [Pseudomonadota bacterium]
RVMSTDPTPMAWMRSDVPYLYRWIDHCDDASGMDGAWVDGLSGPVQALLGVAGETYLPFLVANAAALEAGEKTFSLEIEGGTYEQGVFSYQAKCLTSLRAAWAGLDDETRSQLSLFISDSVRLLA